MPQRFALVSIILDGTWCEAHYEELTPKQIIPLRHLLLNIKRDYKIPEDILGFVIHALVTLNNLALDSEYKLDEYAGGRDGWLVDLSRIPHDNESGLSAHTHHSEIPGSGYDVPAHGGSPETLVEHPSSVLPEDALADGLDESYFTTPYLKSKHEPKHSPIPPPPGPFDTRLASLKFDTMGESLDQKIQFKSDFICTDGLLSDSW